MRRWPVTVPFSKQFTNQLLFMVINALLQICLLAREFLFDISSTKHSIWVLPTGYQSLP